MAGTSLVRSFRKALKRFGAAERGNVMLTFALATVPMIGFVGAAVDYSQGNSAKAAMQAAVDSAALMLSKEAQSLTTAQLNTKALAVFTALFTRPEVTNVTVTPTFTNPSGGTYKLTLAATGKVPTSFTKLIGHTNLNVDVSSQVVWGMKRLEIALALDNTGSMATSNKMTELKKAAKNLLQTLKAAAKADADIKIAIIPFAQEVNVGTSNVSANWLLWDEWDKANGLSNGTTFYGSICYNGTLWVVSGSSLSNGGACDNPTTGICYNGTLYNWSGASFTNNGACSAITVRSKWNGCVMDRDQDYDVNDTAPTTTIKATLFPAKQSSTCPTSILPLTPIHSNYGTLVSKIEAMQPTGTTNVTIGLTWAWHALTPNSPLTEGSVASDNIDKVIILLTDGENTANRWSTTPAAIDARTKKVCDNVKAAKIKLYTVRVIEGNATLLQQCATKTDMYFNVTTASQLDGVFAAISKNLANLYIAK